MNITPTNKTGRPAGTINYKEILYNNKEYIVGTLISKNEKIKFIIDKDEFDKIADKSWHKASNSYISHGVVIDNMRKELYLHNLVMNLIDYPGKGSKETVDHINRIGYDNRKENLRIITQSEQNLNQSKKKRNIILPEESGIKLEDIPTHIWYIKPNGSHGDRFAIEFKTENIIWKTTSSKNISLKDKLESAKQKLQEFYNLYPYLNPKNEEKIKKINELTESYNEIIRMSEN